MRNAVLLNYCESAQESVATPWHYCFGDELTKVEYAVVEADVLSGDAVEIIWMILKTEVFYGGVKGDYEIQRIGGIL